MKIKILTLTLLLLCFAAGCFADMYIWTDDNGVKHYADSPPPGAEMAGQVKQYETPMYAFNHRLYRKQDDQEFCGQHRLPEKGEDPKIFFLNVLETYKSARKNRDWASKQYMAAPTEPAKKSYSKQKEEFECMMEWGKAVSSEMEPVKRQIIQEARLAQKEYDDLQNRCGQEPSPGWHADEETKRWAECQKRVQKRHNKLLHQLKNKLNMEQALQSALSEN